MSLKGPKGGQLVINEDGTMTIKFAKEVDEPVSLEVNNLKATGKITLNGVEVNFGDN